MTPRSIRRAAERKARKLARKAEKTIPTHAAAVTEPDMPPPAPEPDPDEAALLSVPKTQPDEAAPLSEPKTQRTVPTARLAANQANARLSTGPRSAAGKGVSSLNALKTGLTGRTILLPSEDVEHYQRHVARFFAEYNPATDEERELVQCIADTAWRLLRIPALESGLFALARIQLKDMFQDQAPELRASLIDAQALVVFQKQFTNLGIQESRLMRRFAKTRAELGDLQSRRRTAKPQPAAPKPAGDPIGFEFSTAEPGVKTATLPQRNGAATEHRASARP